VLAGGVVGALLFVAAALLGLFWYRRRRAASASRLAPVKEDIPAPASTVLNRPDPTEKPSPPPTELNTVRVYPNSSNTTIDLDPKSQSSAVSSPPDATSQLSDSSNPFTDAQSIQTTGTDGTNVIPIALVAPASTMASSADAPAAATTPVRPNRSPELNLDHVNISHESLRLGTIHGAPSERSGISGISSRNSYMSNASYSSDFLNETAMMVTPAVRQVLGVVKAEVIQTPGSSSSPSASGGLKVPTRTTRPIGSSPLALASYGPADLAKEIDEGQEISVDADPFDDEHTPLPVSGAATIAPSSQSNTTSPNSSTTFGGLTSHPLTGESVEWHPESPNQPWSRSGNDSRPSSMSTQDGSVVDIGSATRVNVGLTSASSPLSGGAAFHRLPYRTTIGRLVTPVSNTSVGTLEEQQQRALAHAQARAQAQGLDKDRRVSNSSVLSAASTRADSILESFPFVPPSPISDRPIRSPPQSPLAQQVFNGNPPTKETPRSQPTESQPKPIVPVPRPTPPPPNRGVLGLSTGSDFSTLSSGLGLFPFQIDSGNGSGMNTPPPAFKGRQRASLDTLALTSDLSSYPLGFDRNTIESPATFKKSADSS